MIQNWFNLCENGWCFLNTDNDHYDWINEAKKQIKFKFSQNVIKDQDFRSGSTWFVGTNFLDNNSQGKARLVLDNLVKKLSIIYQVILELKFNIGIKDKFPFVGLATRKKILWRVKNLLILELKDLPLILME